MCQWCTTSSILPDKPLIFHINFFAGKSIKLTAIWQKGGYGAIYLAELLKHITNVIF